MAAECGRHVPYLAIMPRRSPREAWYDEPIHGEPVPPWW